MKMIHMPIATMPKYKYLIYWRNSKQCILQASVRVYPHNSTQPKGLPVMSFRNNGTLQKWYITIIPPEIGKYSTHKTWQTLKCLMVIYHWLGVVFKRKFLNLLYDWHSWYFKFKFLKSSFFSLQYDIVFLLCSFYSTILWGGIFLLEEYRFCNIVLFSPRMLG